MKRHSQSLAGTALGLLMASAPLAALPLPERSAIEPAGAFALDSRKSTSPLMLAQAECRADETAEDCARRLAEEAAPGEEPAAEEPAAEEPAAEEPVAEEPAAEQPAAEEPAAEEPAAEPPAAEEPASPVEEPAAEEPAAEEPAAEEPATEEPAAEEPAAEQPAAEPPAAEEPAPPVEEPAVEEPAAEQPAADQPAAEEPAPPVEEPAVEEPASDAPAAAEPAAEEPAAEESAVDEPVESPAAGEPAAGEPATTQEPAAAEQPAAEQPAAAEPEAAPGDAEATGEERRELREERRQRRQERREQRQEDAAGEETPAEEPAAEGEPLPENAAPVLDSAKEDPAAAQGEQPAQAAEPAGPPPASDAEAQAEDIAPEEIEPITAEEGQRLDAEDAAPAEQAQDPQQTREERQQARQERRERRRERREERRERRENAEVVEEFDDNRVIIEIGGAIYIESPDYERIILDDDDVFYEELSNGRTREVIIRPNGVRVVTIRNRYGDVIRRSKIYPDDREVVLVYVPERYYDEVIEFRDPAEYLPPLELNIPVSEYILEAETVEDPDRYYTFLDQPPVAEIERTYSIEEVKRSARVRDTMRRIDLDTINFEFGSAEITESEIDELEAIADAIMRMLDENPGETFLIEGHTDAVGTDLANLALSDRRAENVARALTDVFSVPPENLTTQGYGEQYLKIETEEPERENRRVAIRRITPLVAPVASAE